MDVLIKKIRYIKGIPEELTGKAIHAGELKKGKTVGLDVKFNEYGTQGLIELRLMHDGQEALIKEGNLIPVEEKNSVHYLEDYWRSYIQASSKNTLKSKTMQAVIEPNMRRIDWPIRSHF